MSKRIENFEPNHQGDIFIRKVANTLGKLQGKKIEITQGQGLVVHHGEALGHYHRIRNPELVELTDVRLEGACKIMQLQVKANTFLDHTGAGGEVKEGDDLHDPIELTPGEYEIRTQQELSREGFLRPVGD